MQGEKRLSEKQFPQGNKNIENYFKTGKEEFFKKYFEELKSMYKTKDEQERALFERKNLIINEIKLLEDLYKKNEELAKGKAEEFIKLCKYDKLPIFINGFEPEFLTDGANYDLRLGSDAYVTTKELPVKLDRAGVSDTISIEPGEFGVLMTHEYLYVPQDLMGFISIRVRYKNKGLVNISGFHVDPGFYGKLIFAVYNAGPRNVVLRHKEPVFMIMFDELTSLSGPYQGPWKGQENIPVDTISALRGTSISVRNLDERVKKLETEVRVLIIGILIPIVLAIIALLLR